MDDTLLAAFRDTHYLVCLDACQWADIRVDQALPAALRALVEKREWGFVTAWNPQARERPEEENLAAQRELHAALTQIQGAILRPAIGLGSQWHEPSFFVVGINRDDLDELARRHRQLGYVHGTGGGPAHLRLLP